MVDQTRSPSSRRQSRRRKAWEKWEVGSLQLGSAETLEDRTLLATFTVTTLEDENDGASAGAGRSLREAIDEANATANSGGPDIIDFAGGLSGTITLGSMLSGLSENVNIVGPGADQITVSGNNAVRIFTIQRDVVALISGLTITNGVDQTGGGIANVGGNLTVLDSFVTGNSATNTNGGGILNTSGGTLFVQGTTISSNSAANFGGGIYNFVDGSLTVINSTLSQNTAARAGGGIAATRVPGMSTTTIINSTITRNVVQSAGDGGGLDAIGTETVFNTIISGNTFSGGGADDLNGAIETSSNNLIGGDAGLILDLNLADNGGPTPTHAILAGGAAVNTGDNSRLPRINLTRTATRTPRSRFHSISGAPASLVFRAARWISARSSCK